MTIRRFFWVFNLLLAIFLTLRIYVHYTEPMLPAMEPGQEDIESSGRVHRIVAAHVERFANIFAVSKDNSTQSTPAANASRVNQEQLIADGMMVKLGGIFSSSNGKFAVLYVKHKGEGNPRILKVTTGSKVGQYTIYTITRNEVCLISSSGKRVTLKIFRKGQSLGKNEKS